jgi:hypothetical protein
VQINWIPIKEEIMIKERAWPAKAMYLLIAAALAISLIIMAAPALKVSADPDVDSEWDRVTTPTTDGWVLAINSTIFDYALADGGETAYAIVYGWNPDPDEETYGFWLLQSDDHAATWDDITDALEDVDETHSIMWLLKVATDWEDPDFVAVALWEDSELRVYISDDGGTTFEDAGEVTDGGVYRIVVSDLAVSYEDDGEREMAIGGQDDSGDAGLFRSSVDGDSAGSWKDATDTTDYPGWDNMWPTDTDSTDDLYSDFVTDIIFSPSWDEDNTILVTTFNPTLTTGPGPYDVYLQCGSWGTSSGWNEKSTLGIEAVPIKEGVDLPDELVNMDARAIAGMTLPEDYNSDDTDSRLLWVWVNYYDSSNTPMCEIARVDDDSADPVGPMGQVENGEVWLTNVSYQGTIAEGEAIAGVLGDGGYPLDGDPMDLFTPCCDGVQVYRNDGIAQMDICCIRWKDACKPPTGTSAMAVSYVGEDKAYAVALWGLPPIDEGAWSVTFDDGDTWNQLSLIDTKIDYLSDVAVSPDCNKTMLVSVNDFEGEPGTGCGCDSVWLHAEDLPEAEEYSDQWLRTWCDELEGDNSAYDSECPERGLLRLAPEETTGDTVLLVDRMSGNVYWNDMETLACWDPIPCTVVTDIIDLAAQDKDTLYALSKSGKVTMFDDDEWYEEVDSELNAGWTIAVWGDDILVGGQSGEVSYSADTSDEEDWEDVTFEELDEDGVADTGLVTVAFDSYYDSNGLVFAALAGASADNGVYRWVIDEYEIWEDLGADPHDYTGLVVDNADGNPMTDADTGGVLYASYVGDHTAGIGSGCDTDETWYTGVARRLFPAEDVICEACGEWDYLTVGLTDSALFMMMPDALKICGCLTPDTNSKLFAIDGSEPYDMDEFLTGSVWTFEDCYAKGAPELTSPEDGYVVPADPCACSNVPFTLRWDRQCDACSYDIQIALDEEFDELIDLDKAEHFVPGEGAAPAYHVPAGLLTCEFTYYWRVRSSDAETCQLIRSWWSESQSITIAPSVAAGEIDLVAPEPGATGVAIKNVGFSWDLSATADSFDWVLDDNADLSSPVESKTGLTSTAYGCTQTLDYSTTYYWQVTAYNEGAEISTSAVGTFTTTATGEFCCPQCGLCFDTQAELEDHIADAHPAQPATPMWVWVVIAIGAVLVIVVIVLIFRTRRV